jgi:molybdopterin-biosynthesis enzyme MoeA-like protein
VELGVKTLIALPGVPREMEYIMKTFVVDYLKDRYHLEAKSSCPG